MTILRELTLSRLLCFGRITVEFALIIGAFCLSNIESDSFELVVTLALAGFVIHHFLPVSLRQTFFGMLSCASVLLVFGGVQGAWLLGSGRVLIALCHLPVAFWVRVRSAWQRVAWRRCASDHSRQVLRRYRRPCGRSWARCSCSGCSFTCTT